MNRAELLTSHPDLFSEVRRRYKEYSTYSYLNDFDLALEYANKDAANPLNSWSVVNFSISRGDAAYRLGEFDIALDSYSSANNFWNENPDLACNASPNECEREKKYRDSILRMKFVRVYMKLQKWETALTYMNPYLEHFPNTLCPEPFLVRARIYRELGKNELASADTLTARTKLPHPSVSCYEAFIAWNGLL